MNSSSINLFSLFSLWHTEDLSPEKVIREIKKIKINPDFFYLELGIADTFYVFHKHLNKKEYSNFVLRGGTCINQIHLPRKAQRFSNDIDFSTPYKLGDIQTCFSKVNENLLKTGKITKFQGKEVGKILKSSQFEKWEMPPQMANITYKRYTPKRVGLEKFGIIDHNIQINNVSKVKPLDTEMSVFDSFIFDSVKTELTVFVNSVSLNDCLADKIKCLAPFKSDDKYVLGRPPSQTSHIARDIFDIGNVIRNQDALKREVDLNLVLKKLDSYADLESQELAKDHVDILKRACKSIASFKDEQKCVYIVNGLILSKEEKFDMSKWRQFCSMCIEYLTNLFE